MFIKSVILDGFKSYGTRTEIKGFDHEFNAITGLNGTGKSNILDSICFVLGITNLSHVRASSLKDLIYKRGQAGVTKASVTIVFDNSDTNKSPINYERCEEITVTRQIVVSGKNRYMINGSTVTQKHVIDFFNSIHLNVNNPHFLIMQGRITKVLNMKPPEILSMIEEAAGTSMYENKKQGAQKTIEKKDSRLKAMDGMVTEQINPTLQRLKDERSEYMEYQKVQRELDQLTRISVAWQYLQTEEKCKSVANQIEQIKVELANLQKNTAEGQNKIKELEEQINEAHRKRDEESGGKLQMIESQLKENEKAEAKISARVKSTKDSIDTECRKQKDLEKDLKEDEKSLSQKKGELATAQSVYDSLRGAEQEDAMALAAAQKKFQAVSSGLLASDDGEDASMQDQVMMAKENLTQKQTELKQCTMELEHLKKELSTKEPQLKKTEMAYERDKKELNFKEQEYTTLLERLKNTNYEDGLLDRLQDKLRTLNGEMRQCSEIVNNFERKFPQLSFHYKDPEPNFNRNTVRGLLCKLFTVKDPKFVRALETAAGGKLYNVVVDNEKVGAKLIEKGQLLRRTTFAPIDKIQGYSMNHNVVQKAKQMVGEENVFLAQSLINYDPVYEKIMAWAFGNILICTDGDIASKVCYHRDINKKTVTLDGDVYDPAGTISGGAAVKTESVLGVIREVTEADRAVANRRSEIAKIDQQIRQIENVAAQYNSVKQKIQLQQRELDVVRVRLEQTAHYQLQKELENIKTGIEEKISKIEESKIIIKEKSKKVLELENKMRNVKDIKEKQLKEAEADLKKAKKKAEDSRNSWKKREQEFETLTLEINELETCVKNGKDQLIKNEEVIKQLQNEFSELKEEHKKAEDEVKAVKAQVKAQKDSIGQKSKEINMMVAQKDKLIMTLSEIDVECKQHGIKCNNLKSDQKEAQEMVMDLKKKYTWIEGDREFFGQPNGMYDFKANDPREALSKVKKLTELKEKLRRNVNTKAFDMLGTQEEQFQEVMTKKTIIEEDRSKILSVIEELDVKKEEVIRKAWEKVNGDFNSILSSLLPSAHAKLMIVDPKDIFSGLQVKVGFGGIWKESLDELSGGQRSLVALSLILAMLLFNPAPLYILDEVDAALDPSHTQNIGQMLKAHFRQSQFIIVSLKDGMFNNANVLFRTSFVDGMSAVIRTTNSGRK